MKNRQALFNRKNLAVGITAALSLSVSSVFAGKEDVISLELRDQSIQKATMMLAEKSGVQIILSEEVSSDIKLQSITGNYTLGSALDQMLDGTGLTYEFNSNDLLIIKEEPQGSDKNDGDKVDEEVVVTGTRLKNTRPTAPVVTITREDIDKQGLSTAADIIRSLPQNFSSVNVGSSTVTRFGNIPAGAEGTASADLRGLGADATLVLVNGRRLAGNAVFSSGQINLSTIPSSAIERVEVVLDGASAIYGSDAIAGVINFILKSDYVGSTTKVRYDNSAHDADAFTLSQTLGVAWD